jgi:hypothetical protein
MNLFVYVFIIFAIVNFVNKFGEIYQSLSNFSFIDFDDSSIGNALGWSIRTGFVANSPAFYLEM